MKIKKQDYDALKVALESVINPELINMYESGDFPRSEKTKDLQMRFCFDALHLSGIKIGDGVGVQGDINLYGYMNDDHIYTALKAICPKVVKRF